MFLIVGIYEIGAGKRGNYSFEIYYPKIPNGQYFIYTGNDKFHLEHDGATYLDHGEWETYIIYDLYMRTSMY